MENIASSTPYGVLSTTKVLSAVSILVLLNAPGKIINMAVWHIVRARKLGFRRRWCVLREAP